MATTENDKGTIEIVERFFQALDRLKTDKVIGGLKTYTERYGLNRWNVSSLRKDPAECYGRFRPSWLQHLVRDYKVSPFWLLLGEGDFYTAGFSAEIVKKLQENRTKK